MAHQINRIMQALASDWLISESGQDVISRTMNNIPLLRETYKESREAEGLINRNNDDYPDKRYEIVGKTAIISFNGPVLRYTSVMEMCGYCSYSSLNSDFSRAENDTNVENIILRIDSPGGMVTGIDETAKRISNSSKPTIAFCENAASAAYWIATSCAKVTAASTAVIGSVGAVTTVQKEELSDGTKLFKFVSAVSPLKQAGPDDPEGAKKIQELTDDMGSLFVDEVASNRNVSRERVLTDFGEGSVMIAKKALDAGMIDEITTLDNLLASVNNDEDQDFISTTIEGEQMPIETSAEMKAEHPALCAEIEKQSAEAERLRCSTILSSEEYQGREELGAELISQGLSAEQSLKILSASPKKTNETDANASSGSLDLEMSGENPDIESSTGGEADEFEELMASAKSIKG